MSASPAVDYWRQAMPGNQERNQWLRILLMLGSLRKRDGCEDAEEFCTIPVWPRPTLILRTMSPSNAEYNTLTVTLTGLTWMISSRTEYYPPRTRSTLASATT